MAQKQVHRRIKNRPDPIAELNNLAISLFEAKQFEEAFKVTVRGLEQAPDHYELLGNHAVICTRLDFYQHALTCHLKQLEVKKSDPSIWVNAGNTLRSMGNLAESEYCLRQAIALGGFDGIAHYNLSMTLLLGGKLGDGFAAYERRFESNVFKDFRRSFAIPQWDGNEDLAGKRLLLWYEQGNGDMIQFARYAQQAQQRGAEVLMETPAMLFKLFANMMPGITLVPRDGEYSYDLQCPLLSLAHKCGVIPPPVKAAISPALSAKWNGLVSEMAQYQTQARKIALVWAGNPGHANDRNRSLSLEALAPLLSTPNACWFSLQVGPASADLARLSYPIYNLAPYCNDFIETAAAIEQMDLVISVDTSVAHLAGTQGKPVWTLLPFAPDWRWMLGCEDTPWYPSMRLFRQPEPRNWNAVISTIADSLRG